MIAMRATVSWRTRVDSRRRISTSCGGRTVRTAGRRNAVRGASGVAARRRSLLGNVAEGGIAEAVPGEHDAVADAAYDGLGVLTGVDELSGAGGVAVGAEHEP